MVDDKKSPSSEMFIIFANAFSMLTVENIEKQKQQNVNKESISGTLEMRWMEETVRGK